MRKSTWIFGGLVFVAFAFQHNASDALVCPDTFPGVGTPLDETPNLPSYATTTNAGVDFVAPDLVLHRELGEFSVDANVNTGGAIFRAAASLDVDNDGWVDVVAGQRSPQTLRVLINNNQTAPNPPEFIPQTPLPFSFGATGVSGSVALVGGDFNGDGFDDLIRMRANAASSIVAMDFFGNTGAGTLATVASSAFGVPSNLGRLDRTTTSMVAVDWDGDPCTDILFGNRSVTAPQISILTSDCTTNPQFLQTVLFSPASGFVDGMASIGYEDVDLDGHKDIVASSPDTDGIYLFLSDGSGGFNVPGVAITTTLGNAQGLWVADFNLDGYPDLVWSRDSTATPVAEMGKVYYWRNTGSSPYFTGAPEELHDQGADIDAGTILDFDHDGDGSLDLVIGDVAGSVGSYVTIRNGTEAFNVSCGIVASGTIDISAIATVEFTVDSARITPNESVDPNEDIIYQVSNTSPETWVTMNDCDGILPRGPDWCATFPTPSGREIRWRAQLCRDPLDDNSTPLLSGLDFSFDYTPNSVQFAAGVVASNGILYAGGFQDVGDRGLFFAVDAELGLAGAPLWEASDKIDNQLSRSLYTTEFGFNTLVPFENPASSQLQGVIGQPLTTSNAVVDWVKSTRFGQSSPSTFGAIVNSTAAVMTPPGLPAHYTFLSDPAKTIVDAFISAQSLREVLVFVTGKAGIIHALRSDPDPPIAATSGEEAWGFIPDRVAQNYYADYNANLAPNPYSSPTRYMDGAPTLADVWDGSKYITNVIVGGGDGSTVTTSLDVTNTAAPVPLWTQVIGPAGNVTTKPAVIHVDDSSHAGSDPAGKFMIVTASGLASAPTSPFTKGKRVSGLDVAGNELWFFETACPVTTDITAYETDDGGFAGGATIDGFHDQVVFADHCGNVYMLNVNDPALFDPLEVSPPVLATQPAGLALDALDENGNPVLDVNSSNIQAVFTTRGTTGAIGAMRPIAGGIGARPDNSTDMVLYFGTGGLEQFDPTLTNEFYAVLAKDGTIRASLAGNCPAAPSIHCEKFYGGTVITSTQVLFTATVDPVNSGACDNGAARVLFANNVSTEDFSSLQEFVIDSAVFAPVFAAANALYITTVEGKVQQLGNTSAPTAGSNPGQSTSSDNIKGEYIAISGWRQLLY